jgi:hypothetical protein
VALGPVVSRARVSVHEVLLANEFTERRRARSVDHAGLEIKKHRAGHVLAVSGLVVDRLDAAELRVVVAALLAVAADAVLVEIRLSKLGSHLVTALTRLNLQNLAQKKKSLEAGSAQEKKGRGGAKKRKKFRVVDWHGKQEMSVARARESRAG